MRIWIVFLVLVFSLASLRADDKIASVQQSLKDQGFYYGDVTGEKNADTTAAIRRFQIRNGLQISGELNDETLKALRSAPTTPSPVASPPVVTRAPSPPPDASDLRDDSNRSEPPQPRYAPPSSQDRHVPPPVYPGGIVPPTDGNFVGTPYESAPPEVQHRVIVDAQKTLARHGLFKNEVNGLFGPELEFSLRAYQSRVGLRPTGRLDLETLAALELLPGANQQIYTPRRVYREPPVRGEWIRP